MHKGFLTTGALLGGLAVGLGAFGAHSLQQATQDEKIIHSFQTAVQYQMYHALALLAVAIIFQRMPVGLTKWAGNCFVIGTILFSGSLYGITAIKLAGNTTFEKIGVLTPIGGVFFIAGWVFLLIAALNRSSTRV